MPINQNLSNQDYETAKIMAKLLNVSQQDILESINLFSHIDSNLKNCFCHLYKMKQEDYISASMLLNYLRCFGEEDAKSLIDREDDSI